MDDLIPSKAKRRSSRRKTFSTCIDSSRLRMHSRLPTNITYNNTAHIKNQQPNTLSGQMHKSSQVTQQYHDRTHQTIPVTFAVYASLRRRFEQAKISRFFRLIWA
ncbi:hypothetical protein KIN20_018840 [Parelaphostrongylus tenuis]|uniref:Uncharacterized protein n=1 Tax=Parelaphostrongylus tenuis TaxID=148309 RepID=A0AAD5MKK1_PARTN|nr:hypothetical protein KIN20_018840 [Parelaphostrongylus tenuis]